jgi:hypothetical protein
VTPLGFIRPEIVLLGLMVAVCLRSIFCAPRVDDDDECDELVENWTWPTR